MPPPAYPPHLLAPVGILDPEGLRANPLTGQPYRNVDAASVDPKTGEPKTYAWYAKHIWKKLRVYEQATKILKDIHNHQVIIALSGTGTGKTVIFPKLALHAVGYDKKVLCAIPRQLPCKGMGEFSATCMDVTAGEEVGYFFKGNRKRDLNHRETKLLFGTTGSIEMMMNNNPNLDDDENGGNFACLLIDEVHERTTAIDAVMQHARLMLRNRPEMKLIVMSATIDMDWYANYFKEFDVHKLHVEAPPTFPRKLEYLPKPLKNIQSTGLVQAAVERIVAILKRPPIVHSRSTRKYLTNQMLVTRGDLVKTREDAEAKLVDGDILVFLPSVKTAAYQVFEAVKQQTKKYPHIKPFFCTKLESKSQTSPIVDGEGKPVKVVDADGNVLIEALMTTNDQGERVQATEAKLATDAEMYLSHPDNDPANPFVRKLIVATDVAESSLTFEGPLSYVIDSGVSLDSKYLPKPMEVSLLPEHVAKGPIQQREGRTGRTCPGICYHLYTEDQYKDFPEIPPPEMSKTEDLPQRILRVMGMEGRDSVGAMHTYFDELPEPPPVEFRISALRTLVSLNAITPTGPAGTCHPTDSRTFLGRAMSFIQVVPPHQTKTLVAAYYYKCLREMAEVFALVDTLSGKGIDELVFDKRKQWKNKSKGVHPDLVSFGSTAYGDHITLLRTYTRYRLASNKALFCRKHNVRPDILRKVRDLAMKIQRKVEDVLERTDELLVINDDELLDKEAAGGVGRAGGEAGARTGLTNRRPRKSTRKAASKAHGGNFEVAADYSGFTEVNLAGGRDLAVLYALYPECKRSVRQMLLTIARESRSGAVQPSLEVLYPTAAAAREALSRSVRTLPIARFERLSEAEQKAVVAAYKATIRYRKREMKDFEEKKAQGLKPTIVGDELDAKGHAHWIKELEAAHAKAKELHAQVQREGRRVRRVRVKERLREYFTPLPDDYYEPEWKNIELRLMRAMVEGYYVQMALRVDAPTKKRYVTPFPSQPTVAQIDDRSTLGREGRVREGGPVCLYEILHTRQPGQHSLVLTTVLPRRIWASSAIKSQFVDAFAAALPQKYAEKLSVEGMPVASVAKGRMLTKQKRAAKKGKGKSTRRKGGERNAVSDSDKVSTEAGAQRKRTQRPHKLGRRVTHTRR